VNCEGLRVFLCVPFLPAFIAPDNPSGHCDDDAKEYGECREHAIKGDQCCMVYLVIHD